MTVQTELSNETDVSACSHESDVLALPRFVETIDLLDRDGACALIGGNRPINPATLYRGIKSGLYPEPIKVAPNVSRWVRNELLAAIKNRIMERDIGQSPWPEPTPRRRGRRSRDARRAVESAAEAS